MWITFNFSLLLFPTGCTVETASLSCRRLKREAAVHASNAWVRFLSVSRHFLPFVLSPRSQKMTLLLSSLSPKAAPPAIRAAIDSGAGTRDRGPPEGLPEPPSECPFHRKRESSWWGRMQQGLPSSWLRKEHVGDTGGERGNNEASVASHGDDLEIDPRNMMPNLPNTNDTGLGTKRETSSIPKTGEDKRKP